MATTNSNAIPSNSTIAAIGNAQQFCMATLPASETIDTTTFDTAADVHRLVAVPNGCNVFAVVVDFDALDSGSSVDIDIIKEDDDGNTILYNAGTAFASAVPSTAGQSVFYLITNGKINAKTTGVGYISLLMNVAPDTGVSAANARFAALYQ